MTTAEILRAARALIDTPDKWTTEVLAEDNLGRACPPRDVDARRFCMVGAVLRVTGDSMLGDTHGSVAAECELCAAIDDISLGSWNDSHTHADVLTAFDHAIKAAEQ